MNTIRDLINKNIEDLADKLTKTDYDNLEKGLAADINAILPPELANIITPEERVASSISHITDAGMYAFAEAVLLSQMSHTNNSASCSVGRCMACQNAAFERDCKIMIPIVITIVETIYPVLSQTIGLQPMARPVDLTYFLRHGNQVNDDGEKRLSIQIINKAVEAGSRKLQARWVMETAQDLNHQHDVDVYDEVTAATGQEIAQEIMAEIMGDLYHLGHEEGYESPVLEIEHVSDLAIEIFTLSKNIARDTRRGDGNFVIVSPLGLTLLQSDQNSKYVPGVSSKDDNVPVGMVKYAGTMIKEDQAIQVFCNVMDDNDNVIVGYKGVGEVDVGYVYCPYVILMTTSVVMDPNTFEPIMTFMTRYGKSVTGENADETNLDGETGRSRNYFKSFNIADGVDFTSII